MHKYCLPHTCGTGRARLLVNNNNGSYRTTLGETPYCGSSLQLHAAYTCPKYSTDGAVSICGEGSNTHCPKRALEAIALAMSGLSSGDRITIHGSPCTVRSAVRAGNSPCRLTSSRNAGEVARPLRIAIAPNASLSILYLPWSNRPRLWQKGSSARTGSHCSSSKSLFSLSSTTFRECGSLLLRHHAMTSYSVVFPDTECSFGANRRATLVRSSFHHVACNVKGDV